MSESAERASFAAFVAILVVGSVSALYVLRGALSSECGGFSCMPGSVVLPGKDLHYFSDHAAARCAGLGFADLTKSAANSAKTWAKRTYPVGKYSELEQGVALAGCVEGIRFPLHVIGYVLVPEGPTGYFSRIAADVCAQRGIARVAREFEVAPQATSAARAYAVYKYPIAAYGKRAHELFYAGCLDGFRDG